MGSGKQRWKIYFQKAAPPQTPTQTHAPPPKEFLCPISGALMVDPVIVASGHTFERNCINACISLNFIPTLPDASSPDFSAVIPNLALKAAILNWCHATLFSPPKPLDFRAAENLVRALMASSKASPVSSEESRHSRDSPPATPLPLTTKPSCYSTTSSSSDIDILTPEEDDYIAKLNSSQIFEQEEGLISLRKLTRTWEESRVQLCTPRMLSALRALITSKYSSIQVNSVAVLVNLSLENLNKVKIVRSGIVPPLIDVLRGGFPDSQDHAAGAIFSLAIDEQNKTAIGVLGALSPLLNALRSDSERTRHDAALALYHLSSVHSNRVKMVKLGSVQILLGMAKSGHMTSRVLLVLCNLAGSHEGRAAMLDGGAVECFVEMLSRDEFDSESTRETCVMCVYGLSQGGLRFKGLAKEAEAEAVLRKVEERVAGRSREKVRRIVEVLTEKEEEEAAVDWEELLNSDGDTSGTLPPPQR